MVRTLGDFTIGGDGMGALVKSFDFWGFPQRAPAPHRAERPRVLGGAKLRNIASAICPFPPGRGAAGGGGGGRRWRAGRGRCGRIRRVGVGGAAAGGGGFGGRR